MLNSLALNKRNPGLDDECPCRYTDHDGQPSCVAGTALAALGVALPDFGSGDNVQAFHNTPMAVEFDPHAIRLMVLVQEAADDGDTWQVAIYEGIAKAADEGILPGVDARV